MAKKKLRNGSAWTRGQPPRVNIMQTHSAAFLSRIRFSLQLSFKKLRKTFDNKRVLFRFDAYKTRSVAAIIRNDAKRTLSRKRFAWFFIWTARNAFFSNWSAFYTWNAVKCCNKWMHIASFQKWMLWNAFYSEDTAKRFCKKECVSHRSGKELYETRFSRLRRVWERFASKPLRNAF
jgi:hypothetical protein